MKTYARWSPTDASAKASSSSDGTWRMANQPEWVIEVQRRLPVPATVSSPAAPPQAPDERAPDDGSAAR